MNIKTIPLSHLEADPIGVLMECADSGSVLVVELPNQRLVAIQPLDATEHDGLIKKHLLSNPRFREFVAQSKAGRRRPFPTGPPVPSGSWLGARHDPPLSRYLAGEREQVWSDLLALEDEVRFASNFPHAYAVAKETMRRVRGNIESLVDRLRKIGYQFAHPNSAYLPPDRGTAGQIQEIEESLGPLPPRSVPSTRLWGRSTSGNRAISSSRTTGRSE